MTETPQDPAPPYGQPQQCYAQWIARVGSYVIDALLLRRATRSN